VPKAYASAGQSHRYQGAWLEKTHYDTLKVSHDAPVEVIRAAYRVLSLKHHPDRNPEDPTAAATMGLLNRAYAVLSDPERRRAYDASIRELQTHSPPGAAPRATTGRRVRADSEREARGDDVLMVRRGSHGRRVAILFVGLALVLAGLVAVLLPARGPQLDAWGVATPPPEDREAYIRRLAREVMLPRGDGEADAAADPVAPDSAASPADDLPASATGHEIAPEPAMESPTFDAPGPDEGARAAPDPGEAARSAPGLPAAAVPIETDLPSAETDLPSAETDLFSDWPAASEVGERGPPELRSGMTEDGEPLP
jgi:curved DNA-binding protein CbpA